MPGALPSGSDTSQVTLGDFPSAPTSTGLSGAGLGGLLHRTQDNVTSHYQGQVQGSAGWGFASNILFAGLDAILGFPLALIAAIAETIVGAFIGGTVIQDFLGVIAGFVSGIPLIGGFLAGLIPVNASSLFGNIFPGLLSHVGIGSLANTTPNLLTAGTFPSAASITAHGDWTWDPNTSQDGNKTGSAKLVCDGKSHALRSNPITVAQGQSLSVSAYVQWQGVTSSGSPFHMDIITIQNGLVTGINNAQSATVSGSSSSWVQLSTTYTVPANVDTIEIRLAVDGTASSGTVWWDAADVHQTGLIQQGWINGLLDTFDGIANLFGLGGLAKNLINPIVSDVWSSVASLFLNPLGFFANLIGGLIPGFQIPGLDASKIISGILSPAISGVQLVLNIFSGIGSQFSDLTNVWTNLLSMFGTSVNNLAVSIESFNPAAALATFINSFISTFESFFATVTGGFISAAVIPPIDGAKVTGSIDPSVSGAQDTTNAAWMGAAGSKPTAKKSNTEMSTAVAAWATAAAQAQVAAAAAQEALAAITAENNANSGAGGSFTRITSIAGADGSALNATDFPVVGPGGGGLVIRSIGNNRLGGQTGPAGAEIGIAAGAGGGPWFATLGHQFTTDNQAVIVTLGDQAQWLVTPTYILTHCDSACTQGAYCAITNNQGTNDIAIGSFTRSGFNWTFTPFAGGAGRSGAVTAGSRVESHNNGTTWTVLVNDDQVVSVTNSSITFDSSHRTAAVAEQRAYAPDGFGIYPPGNYDSWGIAAISLGDYVIPTFVGSGALIMRTSATGVNVTTGFNPISANFFDGTESSTADITVDLVNNKFTVSNAGWYSVAMSYATSQVSGASVAPALYKNGTHIRSAPNFLSTNPCIAWTWPNVYLAAGDNIEAGYYASANESAYLIGDGGASTYMSITLLNKSLA